MELIEYEVMFQREDDHWWYNGLHDLMTRVTGRIVEERNASGVGESFPAVLDAGSGTGKLLERLALARVGAVGLELSAEAIAWTKRRGQFSIVQGSVVQLPFANGSFDLVISNDVVCCVEPTEAPGAFAELARVLKPGGRLVLNLPAYEFLRGRHDVAVHTRQRFNRPGLRGLLAGVGLRVDQLSYRNTLLFPVAAGTRLVQKASGSTRSEARSDLDLPPRWLNQLLTLPLLLENRILRAGGSLPFGLSLFAVATKPIPTNR